MKSYIVIKIYIIFIKMSSMFVDYVVKCLLTRALKSSIIGCHAIPNVLQISLPALYSPRKMTSLLLMVVVVIRVKLLSS